MSRQDKFEILCSDGPPERAGDGAILRARDYPMCPARKLSPESHMVYPLSTKLVRSRSLDFSLVFFFFFRVYGLQIGLGP